MPRQDDHYLDAIDRALDGVPGGSDVDKQTLLVIGRLRSMASIQQTNDQWRPRMDAFQASGTTLGPKDLYRARESAGRLFRRQSLVGSISILALIVMVASFVLANGGSDNSDSKLIAAVGSPMPPSTACDGNERNAPFPSGYEAGSEITATRYRRQAGQGGQPVTLDVVKTSELPKGALVDVSIYNEVHAAVADRIACRNAGVLGWNALLVLDPANPLPNDALGPGIPSFDISTIAWRGLIVDPPIAGMEMLADNTVGVTLSEDLLGYGLGEYDVYKKVDNDWILADMVLFEPDAAVDSTGPAQIPQSTEFQIWDTYLSPNMAFLRSDETVTINLRNLASVPYVVRIPDLDVDVSLDPGALTSVEIIAPAGDYYVQMFAVGDPNPTSTRILRLAPQE